MKNRWHSTIRPSRIRSQKLASIKDPTETPAATSPRNAAPAARRSNTPRAKAKGKRASSRGGGSRADKRGEDANAKVGAARRTRLASPRAKSSKKMAAAGTPSKSASTRRRGGAPPQHVRTPSPRAAASAASVPNAVVDAATGAARSNPRQPCNCRKSKCIKLYCECFAAGQLCQQCNCQQCYNVSQHEAIRQKAIHDILQRNPNAFKLEPTADVSSPRKGCNCKKSGCKKKYCECFHRSVRCSGACQCQGCENQPASKARSAAPKIASKANVHSPNAAATRRAERLPHASLPTKPPSPPLDVLGRFRAQSARSMEAAAASVLSGLCTPPKQRRRRQSSATPCQQKLALNSKFAMAAQPSRGVRPSSAGGRIPGPRAQRAQLNSRDAIVRTSAAAAMLLEAAAALEQRRRLEAERNCGVEAPAQGPTLMATQPRHPALQRALDSDRNSAMHSPVKRKLKTELYAPHSPQGPQAHARNADLSFQKRLRT